MPHSPQKEKILGELTATLKGCMMNSGTLMIGYQPQGTLPNFFLEASYPNAAVQESDVDFMLDELDRLGQNS
ncbi:glutamate decarboxylase [Caerostris extrusa]|uniref:Glutamate decarboxylase n=1 Tax=Caerostris extrusa TaxID=172846 RepID=A0AAV4XBM2_CAEEX|nr:glutamate decarboxylase [Caerostris extrusa]